MVLSLPIAKALLKRGSGKPIPIWINIKSSDLPSRHKSRYCCGRTAGLLIDVCAGRLVVKPARFGRCMRIPPHCAKVCKAKAVGGHILTETDLADAKELPRS